MTAPVITDGITRIPLVPGSNASVNGDRIATLPLVYRAPGQLWERLNDRTDMNSDYAKSVVLSDAYTFQVAGAFNKVNKEQMVRIAHGIGFRGMAVAEAPEAYRSGRIVTGVMTLRAEPRF